MRDARRRPQPDTHQGEGILVTPFWEPFMLTAPLLINVIQPVLKRHPRILLTTVHQHAVLSLYLAKPKRFVDPHGDIPVIDEDAIFAPWSACEEADRRGTAKRLGFMTARGYYSCWRLLWSSFRALQTQVEPQTPFSQVNEELALYRRDRRDYFYAIATLLELAMA